MNRVTTLLALVLGIVGCSNKPPEVTTPAGPTDGRTNTTCQFSTFATDPDADSVALRFDWADADTSAWSEWLTPADTCFATHAWTEPGSYEVRAQAKDIHETFSDWSSALT